MACEPETIDDLAHVPTGQALLSRGDVRSIGLDAEDVYWSEAYRASDKTRGAIRRTAGRRSDAATVAPFDAPDGLRLESVADPRRCPVSDENRNEDELETAEGAPDNPDPPQTAEKAIEDSRAARAAEDDEEDDAAAVDAADPAAIARRVAALGEEDAIERLAREEERKLAERRAAGKKKKGRKGGLDVAASKKLSKIGTRAEPKRSVAVAADADPLIERTAKLSDWARRNQKTVQIVGGLVAAGLLAVAGFLYVENKRETEASVMLSSAIETQQGRVGEPPKDRDDDEEDDEKYYKSFEERREAALGKYREVHSKFSSTGAAILARLAEGSLLLDKRDAKGAAQAFEDVKGSALAAADREVRGRALEGLGFAHELEAQATPAERDKHLDAALAAFRELENTVDAKGFKEVALYHQARVHQDKGDKDKAKELLLKVKESLDKPDDAPSRGIPGGPTFPYLREVAMDRLREIDPEAAPKARGMPGGGGQLTPEQIQKRMEQMQRSGGGDPH